MLSSVDVEAMTFQQKMLITKEQKVRLLVLKSREMKVCEMNGLIQFYHDFIL